MVIKNRFIKDTKTKSRTASKQSGYVDDLTEAMRQLQKYHAELSDSRNGSFEPRNLFSLTLKLTNSSMFLGQYEISAKSRELEQLLFALPLESRSIGTHKAELLEQIEQLLETMNERLSISGYQAN